MDFDSIPWQLVERRNAHEIILLRHRLFAPDFPKKDFPHRLNVFWQMVEATPYGMPESAEMARMQVFEDRLLEAIEPEEAAVLSMVLTGNGQREFVFHARSTDDFLHRLTEMPQEMERYPIEIHHWVDEEWKYCNRVLGDFGLQ